MSKRVTIYGNYKSESEESSDTDDEKEQRDGYDKVYLQSRRLNDSRLRNDDGSKNHNLSAINKPYIRSVTVKNCDDWEMTHEDYSQLERDDEVQQIMSTIASNPQIKKLYFDKYPMGDVAACTIKDALLDNNTLHTISFENCFADIHAVKHIAESVKHNATIQELLIDCPDMECLLEVSNAIKERSTTTHIKLRLLWSKPTKEDMQCLANFLRSDSSLHTLTVSEVLSSATRGPIALTMCDDVTRGPVALSRLATQELLIDSPDMECLPYIMDALRINNTVKTLHFCWNNPTQKIMDDVTCFLRLDTNLDTLGVRGVSTSGLKLLTEALSENKTLKTLDLKYNDILDDRHLRPTPFSWVPKRTPKHTRPKTNSNFFLGEFIDFAAQILVKNYTLQYILTPGFPGSPIMDVFETVYSEKYFYSELCPELNRYLMRNNTFADIRELTRTGKIKKSLSESHPEYIGFYKDSSLYADTKATPSDIKQLLTRLKNSTLDIDVNESRYTVYNYVLHAYWSENNHFPDLALLILLELWLDSKLKPWIDFELQSWVDKKISYLLPNSRFFDNASSDQRIARDKLVAHYTRDENDKDKELLPDEIVLIKDQIKYVCTRAKMLSTEERSFEEKLAEQTRNTSLTHSAPFAAFFPSQKSVTESEKTQQNFIGVITSSRTGR